MHWLEDDDVKETTLVSKDHDNHCNKPRPSMQLVTDCWELYPEKKPGYVKKSGPYHWDSRASVDVEGDLEVFDLSLDEQDGLCKEEDERQYNLMDVEGLVVAIGEGGPKHLVVWDG